MRRVLSRDRNSCGNPVSSSQFLIRHTSFMYDIGSLIQKTLVQLRYPFGFLNIRVSKRHYNHAIEQRIFMFGPIHLNRVVTGHHKQRFSVIGKALLILHFALHRIIAAERLQNTDRILRQCPVGQIKTAGQQLSAQRAGRKPSAKVSNGLDRLNVFSP